MPGWHGVRVEGNPVRVTRGASGDPRYSPVIGLRYDGLFRVVDHWHEVGRDGFRVWRFRLVALEESDLPATGPVDGEAAARSKTTIQRIIRSTAVAAGVKQRHDHTCQVCGIRLMTPAGPYAEAAHIRALGKPHNGPDVESNVLCLCPNDHVLFDTGAIYVDSQGIVRESTTHTETSRLRRAAHHQVDADQLAYHRNHHVP